MTRLVGCADGPETTLIMLQFSGKQKNTKISDHMCCLILKTEATFSVESDKLRDYLFTRVSVSVCWFVSRITQKLQIGFP